MLKDKIKMYYIKKASEYAEKGDYDSILKSLDYLEKSARYASFEERQYLKNMLVKTAIESVLTMEES